mmetsp:Transcript_11379/g.39567  ORF Transcript_11379/g.39567 Transcript_11379/m.39567 type:complete len:237 (-) Transcript_11379:449-1159(-)
MPPYMSPTSMSTFELSPRSLSASISSKLRTPVSSLHRPQKVPPPTLVPLTRLKLFSPSTRRMETPDPMFTRRYGYSGSAAFAADGDLGGATAAAGDGGGGPARCATNSFLPLKYVNASSRIARSRKFAPRTTLLISSSFCRVSPSLSASLAANLCAPPPVALSTAFEPPGALCSPAASMNSMASSSCVVSNLVKRRRPPKKESPLRRRSCCGAAAGGAGGAPWPPPPALPPPPGRK